MLILLGLVVLTVGAVAASSSSSSSSSSLRRIRIEPIGPSAPPGDLETMFQAAAARSAKQREEQEAAARAEVNADYDKVASLPVVGWMFAALGPFAKSFYAWGIDAGKAVASWINDDPDWNSQEEKDRVYALMLSIAKQGFTPPTPFPEDQFKNYGDELQMSVDGLAELWAARPELRGLWTELQGWIAKNPNAPALLDVKSLRTSKGAPIWPPHPQVNGYSWNENGTVMRKPGESALAIATLIAAMRGADPKVARAAVAEFQTVLVPRENPSLAFSDHWQWMLGGVLDAARYATAAPKVAGWGCR